MLATSHLHWGAGYSIFFTAIQKEAVFFCGSFLRKGRVFTHSGRMQNLKVLEMDGWILQVLFCDPKRSTPFLQILSTEG